MFCKNCQTLEIIRMSSIQKELDAPETDDIATGMWDPDSTAPWYIAIRAMENFREKNNRYPGMTEN